MVRGVDVSLSQATQGRKTFQQKIEADPEVLDRTIRECYQRKTRRPRDGAASLGMSERRFYHLAMEIGAVLPRNFGLKERKVFNEFGHESVRSIKARLAAIGVNRDEGTIRALKKVLAGPADEVRAEKGLFTTGELAPLLGVNMTTLERWAREGDIRGDFNPTQKLWLFKRAAVAKFIRQYAFRLEGKASVAFVAEFIPLREAPAPRRVPPS